MGEEQQNENTIKEKGKSKKLLLIIGSLILLLMVGVLLFIFLYKKPHDNAVARFESASAKVNELNNKLDNAVNSAQNILDEGSEPWNPDAYTSLSQAIEAAKGARREVGDMPASTKKINLESDRLEKPLDYTEYIATLEQDSEKLQDSRQLMSGVNDKRSELAGVIAEAKETINSGTPLDASKLTNLQNAISSANDAETAALETADRTVEPNIDFTENINAITSAADALKKSIQQLALVTAPTEAFVIERLQRVETITEIKAVTEDNDPNGNLNKAGGYIAAIYFRNSMVPAEYRSGTDPIDDGTTGGGQVEVYATKEDAIKRNDYLAGFDGAGFLNPGSHTVIGTLVVRTSDELTASQQRDLEAKIIAELTRL